jgi:hypothetical protein
MQDRRYRPGDVLDDYCPRERRITDHAIVAMIDDEIRRTRCASCDAEHEYKGGKVPAPRRKTQPPALFTQVLDNLNGSAPKPQSTPPPPIELAAAARSAPVAIALPVETIAVPQIEPAATAPLAAVVNGDAANGEAANGEAVNGDAVNGDAVNGDAPVEQEDREHGGFRRSLIRATFPRPEGQAPPPRAVPEFTIQSLQNRRNTNQRNAGGANKFRGGRRRPAGGGGSQDNLGPMRFRDHASQQGDRSQDQGQGQGGGRRRRGGKKNR